MKISIVTPVYNSENYLDRLLKSIIAQKYKNYEVVLVDDGSTDNSLKIIKQYQKKDKRIKCTSIENSGPGVARRKGFELSTGDLLFFVDSDDYIPNNEVFQKIVDLYEKEKFDMLLFNVRAKIKREEKVIKPFRYKSLKDGKWKIDYLYKNRISPALWYKIFIKEKMKTTYLCDYRNFEDFYATYLYLNNCNNFYYTTEEFYFSDRDNENSISKTMDVKKISDTVTLLEKTFKEVKPELKFIITETMAAYYIDMRRLIDISSKKADEKAKQIDEIKKLKKFFNLKSLIKMRITIKQYIKYFYYEIFDKSNSKKGK